MENTLKRPTYPIFYATLERSRIKVLSVGYHFVVFKSKLKKRAVALKRLLYLYNS